jgi:hypothetical protein
MRISSNNYITRLSQGFSYYLVANTLANIVDKAAGLSGKLV